MEQVLDAIHQANPRRHLVTFTLAAHLKTVRLFCCVPSALETPVTTQLGPTTPMPRSSHCPMMP